MSHVHLKEGIAKALFVAAAGISILAVALICVFLFANGVPAIAQIGLPEFLFGTTWRPANDVYGIFPMIVGSIYVTAGAIVVGVPTGLLCAIFLSRFASGRVAAVLKPGVELLAGIPSASSAWWSWFRSFATTCRGAVSRFWRPPCCWAS